MPKKIHIHLVSDSTGDTARHVADACLSQFAGVDVIDHMWPLVRGEAAVKLVMHGLLQNPGLVIATFADGQIGDMVRVACEKMAVPYISVLDPVMQGLSKYIGEKATTEPGKQHALTEDYFNRMEAIDFAMQHDDGQMADRLREAEVILLGVSRTSKTPTCIYLSHRGIKAANVPIVPGIDLPAELFTATAPLIVGLTNDPERLVQIRKSRMSMMHSGDKWDEKSAYVDADQVRNELKMANRLFGQYGWPVIDTTRKSVEETAAIILQLYQIHRESRPSIRPVTK